MAKKEPVLGETGLPIYADNPMLDYHETEEALIGVWLLGRVSINWNFCEHYLSTLIWTHFGDVEKGLTVTANLGNRSRADLLLSLTRKFERSKRVVECIEFATKAFNRLRETRNILMHSHTILPHESGKIAWIRTSATAPYGHVTALADESDLNRVSEDICLLTRFLMDISFYYIAKQNGKRPPSLPKDFPLPSKLTQLPPEGREPVRRWKKRPPE
jgi:hypothetical protein